MRRGNGKRARVGARAGAGGSTRLSYDARMLLSDHDVQRLRRAIALARKGRFQVEPNPPVGCVIEQGEAGIVGESWHGAFGGPHAEVGALALAGDAARGATAYISLAPCGVDGKTPPCADALVRAGVARVIYAAGDPNPAEGGAGLARLEAAGVEVVAAQGALRGEGEALLERFRGSLASRRPWVALKWAMSLDGRIAPRRGVGGAISGGRAHGLVHDWRGHADAVAVGVETALADDPRLTCRRQAGLPAGRAQPLRVVFDGSLRLPVDSRLVAGAGESGLLVFTTARADAARRRQLEERGVRIVEVSGVEGRVDLAAALAHLHAEGVRRVLAEGGARIHGALLRQGLADQVSAFISPMLLGGEDAVPAVEGSGIGSMDDALRLEDVAWRGLGTDLLMQGYVPRGS